MILVFWGCTTCFTLRDQRQLEACPGCQGENRGGCGAAGATPGKMRNEQGCHVCLSPAVKTVNCAGDTRENMRDGADGAGNIWKETAPTAPGNVGNAPKMHLVASDHTMAKQGIARLAYCQAFFRWVGGELSELGCGAGGCVARACFGVARTGSCKRRCIHRGSSTARSCAASACSVCTKST
eukprot:gene12509-biopygen19960